MRIGTADDFQRVIWPGTPGPGHEGLRLEFKQELGDQRDAALDVAAFANADGGTLVYGVKEAEGPDGYKVASGLHPIDVDTTKRDIEAAIDRWLVGVEVRPEMFPLLTNGHSILLVHVRPSPRLVVVKAVAEKREGLVFVGRNSHGNYYMGVDEVERRMNSYSARSMRIRMQEFLDSTYAGHQSGTEIPLRLYHGRFAKEPSSKHQNLLPVEWQWGSCMLMKVGEWGATLTMATADYGRLPYRVEVPYELIALAWWQPTSGVEHPGRPAILVAGHVGPTEDWSVVNVMPLLDR